MTFEKVDFPQSLRLWVNRNPNLGMTFRVLPHNFQISFQCLGPAGTHSIVQERDHGPGLFLPLENFLTLCDSPVAPNWGAELHRGPPVLMLMRFSWEPRAGPTFQEGGLAGRRLVVVG